MSLNCTCGLLGNRKVTLCPNGTQLQLLNQSLIDHYRRWTGLMEHTSNHHHDRIWLGGEQIVLVVTNCIWGQSLRAQSFLLSFLFILWVRVAFNRHSWEGPWNIAHCSAAVKLYRVVILWRSYSIETVSSTRRKNVTVQLWIRLMWPREHSSTLAGKKKKSPSRACSHHCALLTGSKCVSVQACTCTQPRVGAWEDKSASWWSWNISIDFFNGTSLITREARGHPH